MKERGGGDQAKNPFLRTVTDFIQLAHG